MKKWSILLAATMLVAQLGLLPAFASGSNLYTEDFNETSKMVLQDGGEFTYVKRPVDGVAVDRTPVEDGTGEDRALLSGQKDNRKASLKLNDIEAAGSEGINGTIIFEGEFRMEGRPAYIEGTRAPAGTVKFFDFLSGNTSLFTLGMGTFNDDSFLLRPLYANSETQANSTTSITVNGERLAYQTWYRLKVEMDTVNGKVTAMIGNSIIVDNQNFWSNASNLPLTQIQATHSNGSQVDSSDANKAHEQPFLLDNIRLYRKTDAAITSDTYTISGQTISGIPDGTQVTQLLENITAQDDTADMKVYRADGITQRVSGFVETGDWLKLEPSGEAYRLWLQSCLLYESFDGQLQDGTSVASEWKKIEWLADAVAVDYDSAVEVGDDESINRALLSKALSGGKVSINTGNLTGAFTVQYQFRVEDQSSTLAAGGLRLISLLGTTTNGDTRDAVGLSTGSSSEEGFHLRPIYGPTGTALNDKGPLLAYKTWHTAVISVDIENNSASIMVNGQNIFDTPTVSLWNETFQDITQLQFYGKSTAEVNFLIDEVQILRMSEVAQAQSSVYAIDQISKTIIGVPFDTDIDTFLGNISYTQQGSGSLTDASGVVKTSGTVATGDKLTVMPGNIQYVITVEPEPVTTPQAQSTVYEVNQEELTIRGVAPGTEIAQFLDNLTYTADGTGILHDENGAEKTEGVITYTDTLTVEPDGSTYQIYTTDILSYVNFNDQTIPPAGWKMSKDIYKVKQRPQGGETDPELSVIPDASDYALYSSGGNNAAANQATFSLRQAEDIEISLDFLVEHRVSDANSNQIKLAELVVERSDGADSAQTLAVCNVAATTGFVITHYPGNGTAVGRQNQPFGDGDWSSWHTLRMIASVQRNSADVWLDGTFIGTAEFQGAKKENNVFTAIRFYNGKRSDYSGETPSPYYIDNITIKTVSSDCSISSERYRVQDSTVSGVLEGTVVEDFWGNIRIPYGASAVLYSTYDEQNPQNNVQRTEGPLEMGDTLVVTAQDQFSNAVYSIRTAAPAEVYFADTSGKEVTSLSQITDGVLHAKAEITNNGAFGNNTTFVLVVTAYQGNEMVMAEYKRATIPVGSTMETIEMEPIQVEKGLTYSACIWDELIPMTPLSLPCDIGV